VEDACASIHSGLSNGKCLEGDGAFATPLWLNQLVAPDARGLIFDAPWLVFLLS
jgi:hypothetical protein